MAQLVESFLVHFNELTSLSLMNVPVGFDWAVLRSERFLQLQSLELKSSDPFMPRRYWAEMEDAIADYCSALSQPPTDCNETEPASKRCHRDRDTSLTLRFPHSRFSSDFALRVVEVTFVTLMT